MPFLILFFIIIVIYNFANSGTPIAYTKEDLKDPKNIRLRKNAMRRFYRDLRRWLEK
jgi:SNF family Na+-dependent transporter